MSVSPSALMQISREMMALQKDPELAQQCVSIEGMVDDNAQIWTIHLLGPDETFYAQGIFKALLRFPPDYPFSPPSVQFTSVSAVVITSHPLFFCWSNHKSLPEKRLGLFSHTLLLFFVPPPPPAGCPMQQK